jgi:positive phototaxis protein PixI
MIATRQQCLRFRLTAGTTVLLPVEQITEILSLPAVEVIPIPQMPPWVLGVYNWRGEVLWIADLAVKLGLEPLVATSYPTILLHSQGQRLGLAVQGVEDMVWSESLQPLTRSWLPPALTAVATGFWLDPSGEALILLNGTALLTP